MRKEVVYEYGEKIEKYYNKQNELVHQIEYYENSKQIEREYYYKNGVQYRKNGPSFIKYFRNGEVRYYEYTNKDGELHREDGPAFFEYNVDPVISSNSSSYECYYQNGKKHREDGPAEIWYYKYGKIMDAIYYLNGIQYEDIFIFEVAKAAT
jgi:antitoxin component YwqK of YwqJK toxin-antitoxin module